MPRVRAAVPLVVLALLSVRTPVTAQTPAPREPGGEGRAEPFGQGVFSTGDYELPPTFEPRAVGHRLSQISTDCTSKSTSEAHLWKSGTICGRLLLDRPRDAASIPRTRVSS